VIKNSLAGQQAGVVSDSLVMTDNLATITDKAVYRVIGRLDMAPVDQALRHTLGL
jgi:mRNA interferase MazF